MPSLHLPRLLSQLVKSALLSTRVRHSSHIIATLSSTNHENKDIANALQKQTILSASSFVKDKAYVNGRWVQSKSGATFDVHNPSNGTLVAAVPHMDAQDTLNAVNAAYDAFHTWKSTTAKERSDLLKEAHKLMLENKEELAYLITTENGKPLIDSLAEVEYSASFCEWFAEEARRIQGTIVNSPFKDKKIFTLKQPVGVCGMITPWNFPNVMISRKACAALAAGCSVVVKPSEDTPLSALAMCEVFERAGFPPGVFNVITCDKSNASVVGKILCGSPMVSHISFTGCSSVGKILLKQSASTVKKCSMELGGNAPFIVFNNADIDKAVRGAMSSKFRNTGQTCLCANRFLVQEGMYDIFIQKMKEAMKELLITADGFTVGATQGPLINSRAVEKVDGFVHDAVDKGASVVLGGKRSKLGGNFYESTLIKDVTTDMRVFNEEIFGPVVAVQKFQSEDEVIDLAHQTRAGLASYVYTQDPVQQWRMAEALEYGIVGINEGLFTAVEAPFGGYKESGLGREGGVAYGIEEYLEVKYLAMGGLR